MIENWWEKGAMRVVGSEVDRDVMWMMKMGKAGE